MIGFAPSTIPEEIFWSTLARASDSGGGVLRTQLWNSRIVRNCSIYSGLDEFSNLIDWDGFTAENIVNKFTIFPYFKRVSGGFYSELISSVVDHSALSSLVKVNRLIGQRNIHNRIVFCPECLERGMSEYGFYFLLREHYLPGVLYCIRHRQWLRKSTSIRSRSVMLSG